MKNIKKVAALTLCMLLILGSTAVAFASIGDTSEMIDKIPGIDFLENMYEEDIDANGLVDSANNLFASGSNLSLKEGMFFGGFGAGKNVALENVSFDDTLAIAALDSISLSKVTVGSSVFAASNEINADDLKVKGNLIVAGKTINLRKDVTANAVIIAGKEAKFTGSCKALSIAASDITIGGTVDGDANVKGSNVVISEDTVVTGTLNVTASEEPEIPSSAKIGNLVFTKIEKSEEDTSAKLPVIVIKEENSILRAVKSVFYWSLSMSLVVLILCWLGQGFLETSAVFFKEHAGRVFGIGALVLLLQPITFIVLCFTVIGIPFAIVFAILFILAICFASCYAGASIGLLVLPKMNKVLASIIGVVAFQIIKKLPFIGWIFSFACILYSLGSITLFFWNGRTKKAPKKVKPIFTDEEVKEEPKQESSEQKLIESGR